MSEAGDFSQLIAHYQLSYANELQAKVSRLDGIIGNRHWLSVGNYKENLVKNILRNRIPKRYEVGTGFVLTRRGAERVVSRQMDILIWDSQDHSPFFRDGEFVIVPPEACMAAIEVKSTLTRKSLHEALSNLDSLSVFLSDHHQLQQKVFNRSVFAFSLGDDLKFPVGLWDGLFNSYSESQHLSLEARVNFSSPHLSWQLPWISCIAVLGQGVIHRELWRLNDAQHVVHTAFRAKPEEDRVDAYGFMEATLLLDLTMGYTTHFASEIRPGFTSMVFANPATSVSGPCYMPVPPRDIERVGVLTGAENDLWVKKAYSPRTPMKRKKRKADAGTAFPHE